MGRKSFRARQHVYLYVALLMLFSGCSLLREPPKVEQVPSEPASIAEPEIIVQPPHKPEIIEEPVESKEARARREAQQYLQRAHHFLAKGEYEDSLRVSQKVVDLVKDQPPADEAVFNMGLVFAHPRNPKKDNKRAIGFFNRVVKQYPESSFVEQAKIWVGVLDDLERLKQIDIEIEEKKRGRKR